MQLLKRVEHRNSLLTQREWWFEAKLRFFSSLVWTDVATPKVLLQGWIITPPTNKTADIWKGRNSFKFFPLWRDSKRDTDVKNSLWDSVGEGEGGMIWDHSIETCILSYVKQIASPGLMHETGCSRLMHWDDPEGWDWEGGGWGVQYGEHMYTCPWFISMYGKNHYNIIKDLASN